MGGPFYVVSTQWKLGALAGDTSASRRRQPGGHKSPIACAYIKRAGHLNHGNVRRINVLRDTCKFKIFGGLTHQIRFRHDSLKFKTCTHDTT